MRSKSGLWLGLALASYAAWAEGVSTTSTQVKPPALSRPYGFHGDVNFDLGGGNTQEGKDTWTAGYLYVHSNLHFHLIDGLRAQISPLARFYSGRAQERYDDDALDTRLAMHDAFVAAEPIESLELKAGILNQHTLRSQMLVSGLRSFPGLQEAVKAKLGEVKGRIMAQQVVPHSYSLNTEREKQESMPLFQTLHLELEGRHWNWFEWKALAGYYHWSNIPSKVVFESVRLGNSPLATPTEANSSFAYSHLGWFGGSELCYCAPSNINFVMEFQRVHNTVAPGDAADAQWFGGGPKFLWHNRELELRYRTYFIESDATVAAYNRSRLGNTNRIGQSAEVKLNFKDRGFSLYGEMFRAKPINGTDVQQRDLEQYYFGVETDYASF